jgi:hypothetical protein
MEIFNQMKSGYDVRSAVAHGGKPDPKDLKVKGERVAPSELGKFVQCVEDIVRAGLYKAFRQLSDENSQMKIDWEATILA